MLSGYENGGDLEHFEEEELLFGGVLHTYGVGKYLIVLILTTRDPAVRV